MSNEEVTRFIILWGEEGLRDSQTRCTYLQEDCTESGRRIQHKVDIGASDHRGEVINKLKRLRRA